MQRYFVIVLAVAVAACAVPAPVDAGFGFRLNGGLAYVTYSDFNDFVAHVNEKELPALGVTGTLDNIHWVPEVNGEVLFSPLPMITVGVGAGIISGKSEFSYMIFGVESIYEHTLRAYPLAVTGYYDISVPGAAIDLYVQGGFAAIYSKITFDTKLTAGDDSEGLDAELTTWGYELHGGGGVKFAIFPKVSIDLGVRGRWASLDGYEGTGTVIGEGDYDVFLAKEKTEDYFLYGPEQVEHRDQYEEASVDLTGFAVTLGVTVSF